MLYGNDFFFVFYSLYKYYSIYSSIQFSIRVCYDSFCEFGAGIKYRAGSIIGEKVIFSKPHLQVSYSATWQSRVQYSTVDSYLLVFACHMCFLDSLFLIHAIDYENMILINISFC